MFLPNEVYNQGQFYACIVCMLYIFCPPCVTNREFDEIWHRIVHMIRGNAGCDKEQFSYTSYAVCN